MRMVACEPGSRKAAARFVMIPGRLCRSGMHGSTGRGEWICYTQRAACGAIPIRPEPIRESRLASWHNSAASGDCAKAPSGIVFAL